MNAERISVLIVEDDPGFAELTSELLCDPAGRWQCSTDTVATIRAAVAALQQRSYEVALLDYHLPDGDGLQLLREIRRLPTEARPAVVMLTADDREEVLLAAMKAGAVDYLRKDELEGVALRYAVQQAHARYQLEQQVARQRAELEEKNRRLETDLAMAREIQQALLPMVQPTLPRPSADARCALHFVHEYRPSGSLGGDFFDVLELSDTQAAVFICDVMGTGVRAALVTALLRGLVERLRDVAADPGRFLAQLNLSLLKILRQVRLPVFASAFHVVADVAKGQFTYACAGHPSPFLIEAEHGRVEQLQPGRERAGPALGVFDEASFATATIPFQPGDVLLLYTDGLYEVRNAAGEEFGIERLQQLIQRHARLAPEKLVTQILHDVQAFAGSTEFDDDVCLLAMQARCIAPVLPRGEN